MTLEQLIDQARERLNTLLDERSTQTTGLEQLRAALGSEGTTVTEAEVTSAIAARDALDPQISAARERVTELEAEKARDDAAAALAREFHPTGTARGVGAVTVGAEPATYRDGGSESYFRDLYMATAYGRRDATDRLVRNDREVMTARALTSVDGAGGEFVPPVWLVDKFVALARPARVSADLCTVESLPSGTDQINLPKILTGTVVAEQTTQNTAFQNTDASTSVATGQVFTLAGAQQLSLQLVEQSPINFDNVVLKDLAADYAQKLDVLVLTANAAGKRGLLSVPSSISVTYTDASPAIVGSGKLWGKISDAIQQVYSQRFDSPNAIIMHPRRWAWFLTALDTQNRPLVVPGAMAQQPQAVNTIGTQEGTVAQGYAGQLQGLSVYIDPNIPTNLGAGTNEDRIIIAKIDDVYLYEGTPKAEAFRETKADVGAIFVRMYNYGALISERYPKSVAVISGTGLVTPTY